MAEQVPVDIAHWLRHQKEYIPEPAKISEMFN
jgi:hypothetical protein